MSLPGNGIFVVQGEMAMLVTAMRRSTRWGSHSFPNEEYDVLMRTFQDLKTILNQVDDLRLLDPPTYLGPFLEVIRSKETTGPVTSLALSAINKFLSYGLIDPTHPSVPATVEDIADAVTHARFVGTDHSSDGVVLMKILQVLRTLMLSPEGAMLTDDSVCEIMLSCFRICFETRLTELLRRNAEQCLRDMTQLIFMRLPQFPAEDNAAFAAAALSLNKREKPKKKITSANSTNSLERKSSMTEPVSPTVEPESDTEAAKKDNLRNSQDKNLINEAEITIEPVESIKSPKKHTRHSSMDLATTDNSSIAQLVEKCVSADETESETPEEPAEVLPPESDPDGTTQSKPADESEKLEEYVNHRGIRFTQQEDAQDLQPYGLACVREVFRFIISLCNPLDTQNTSGMVHLGLCLAGTALEVGADQLARYPSLLYLVKDPLCRNLLSLLSTERISIFALDLQITFLLFEALRFHLKFQVEAFFKKVIEIVSMDVSKANYELKEIQHLTLESLAQIFRIPGICNELYLNYDCDIYCMNVFEEMTKLLSKNVVSATAYNIHTLSLEALMTIIEAIEMSNPKESETEVVVEEEDKERYSFWVTQGTELFNQKPERGIEYLQEHGVLKTPLDPEEVALFLRENPDLDKKMIGKQEKLWQHTTNGEPFANTDAAFRLAYAVIMLNMDQHNHNAKKLNVPMNVEDFVKNLRGCNGTGDFDQAMLEAIFHSIKNEEMVMPAERVGPVRDAYLWRVLQRRGNTAAGRYRAGHTARLLPVAAPPQRRGNTAAGRYRAGHTARLLPVAAPPQRRGNTAAGRYRAGHTARLLPVAAPPQRRGNTAAGRYRAGHTARLLPVAAPPQRRGNTAAGRYRAGHTARLLPVAAPPQRRGNTAAGRYRAGHTARLLPVAAPPQRRGNTAAGRYRAGHTARLLPVAAPPQRRGNTAAGRYRAGHTARLLPVAAPPQRRGNTAAGRYRAGHTARLLPVAAPPQRRGNTAAGRYRAGHTARLLPVAAPPQRRGNTAAGRYRAGHTARLLPVAAPPQRRGNTAAGRYRAGHTARLLPVAAPPQRRGNTAAGRYRAGHTARLLPVAAPPQRRGNTAAGRYRAGHTARLLPVAAPPQRRGNTAAGRYRAGHTARLLPVAAPPQRRGNTAAGRYRAGHTARLLPVAAPPQRRGNTAAGRYRAGHTARLLPVAAPPQRRGNTAAGRYRAGHTARLLPVAAPPQRRGNTAAGRYRAGHTARLLPVAAPPQRRGNTAAGRYRAGHTARLLPVAAPPQYTRSEMVTPADVGPVRDAYLWRVLQRRGNTAAGRYRAGHTARLLPVAAPPQITALSAAFERSSPPSTDDILTNNLQNAAILALCGIERCAALLSRLPPVPPTLTVDTLLLTLCKFTALLPPQPHMHHQAIGVTLGQSTKAQLALRRACSVAARHADCVRDAWRHLLEIVHTLYLGRLLPKSLVEAEDYLSSTGTVSLIRDVNRGSEAGLLSSLYSYIALGETGMRTPTPHEKALIDTATECVEKCNLPGLLIMETKFLQLESLQELIRAMVTVGAPPDAEALQANPQAEDVAVFFLELLGHTLIQNSSETWERDRALEVWPEASSHFTRVLLWAMSRPAPTPTRVLTTLLRTCARLMRSEVCCARALAHLHTLFQLPHTVFTRHAVVISCGLYELVKTSAQNVHTAEEWQVVFSLLCAAGAGAWPAHIAPSANNTASSRSEGSEEEGERRPTSASSDSELSQSPRAHGWILVKNEATTPDSDFDTDQLTFLPYKRAALSRCCEALALVVRDVAHVTPHNCRAAVRAVRIFAHATLTRAKQKSKTERRKRPGSARRGSYEDSSEEEDDTQDQYHMVSLQLLDLMHTLHSRTAQIFKWWRDEADQEQGAEEYDLWEVAWKPLLQGIAEFCTDRRKQVANSAIAYLQRALLAPGLHALGGARWEACFAKVLFPLLDSVAPAHASRANTILCKVFLHHLSALSPRPTFGALWLRIVSVQRALLSTPLDPLTEAALESLKNMILVMHSVRIFTTADGYNDLWYITWEKIGEFLPNLKDELFPEAKTTKPTQPPSAPAPPTIPQPPQISPTHSPTLQPSPPTLQPALNGTPQLVAPVPVMPVSGMVPIRNPLYDQTGLSASVLLQPLNEMVSTPIGISLQSQIPTLYRAPEQIPQPQPVPQQVPAPQVPQQVPVPQILQQVPVQVPQVPVQQVPQAPLQQVPHVVPLTQVLSHPIPPVPLPQPSQVSVPQPTNPVPQVPTNPVPQEPPIPPNDPKPSIVDLNYDIIEVTKLKQSELFAEYMTNPYNDTTISPKEATLYDPEDPKPLLDKKSLSANATPMHIKKTQFGSTDNVTQSFNFTSYFGSVNELVTGSDVFDSLTGEG
ncbi:Golgi-specific brefeldin A-resistance guanine nucleotide exchange factor 1 [Leguminivora glycinivorella]|uniref:Golgi-specific brefeldin A-resistance guanine nucleotide exchange factor 1 n=1 Tax=Leguminivora glycinivorella TaxID=1035111 RepID=UPI0020105C3C|nr:Golgi-specific brefeldin A-resistance guanine nucleotide exchange factor 1 [Leguminivora glycinivorella]